MIIYNKLHNIRFSKCFCQCLPHSCWGGARTPNKDKWGAHTEALITMLLLYFVCNVEYPKECFNVFLFLQRYILKVYDSARLPITLLQFLIKLIS